MVKQIISSLQSNTSSSINPTHSPGPYTLDIHSDGFDSDQTPDGRLFGRQQEISQGSTHATAIQNAFALLLEEKRRIPSNHSTLVQQDNDHITKVKTGHWWKSVTTAKIPTQSVVKQTDAKFENVLKGIGHNSQKHLAFALDLPG